MKLMPRLIPLMLVSLALAGCATTRTPPAADSPYAKMLDEIEHLRWQDEQAASAPATLPEEVSRALLPPLPSTFPAPAEHRFDVDVHDLDARSFFMGLLRDTSENIVLHPEVAGTLSLALRNVTVAEVLEAVRDVYGFDIRRVGSGWQVFPATMQSRTFVVNYLNFNREGSSETRVSSGQLDNESSRGESTTESSRSAAPSSRIQTSSRSDFWTELEASLRLIVGLDAPMYAGESGTENGTDAIRRGEQRRAVIVNPHTGLVMVRAMPAELRDVERFLEHTQSTVTRQVVLEAKILEIELADGFQSGVNWTALAHGSDGGLLTGQGAGVTPFRESGSASTIVDLVRETERFNPFSPESGLDRTAFGGMFSAALQLRDFGAFIELLQTQGDVQVLSSPRIATVNNQKAVIKVGSDEFFVTRVSSTTTTGTTTTTSPEVELTPFFSGIALDVTPQVSPDGDVILHVKPSVSEVIDQTKQLTVFGQQQTLPLAFSSMREADSVVRAANGQIVVIGGLMQDFQRDRNAAVPVLGDLPIVGNLFQHRQRSRRKTELVILLRPVVIDEARQWNDVLRPAAERLDHLYPHTAPAWPPAGR